MMIVLPSNYVENTIQGIYGSKLTKVFRIFQQHYGNYTFAEWEHAKASAPGEWRSLNEIAYSPWLQQRREVARRNSLVAAREFLNAKNKAMDGNGDAPMNENVNRNVHTVYVCFQHDLRPELNLIHRPTKQYVYLTTLDDISVGDIVVVDSPTTQYTCVKVVRVDRNTMHFSANKWVVQKIDDSYYKNLLEQIRRRNELEAALNKALKEFERTMFRTIAAREDPHIASLIAEINRLA